MINKSCLIGVDIGTSTIKVAAFDLNGSKLILRRIDTPIQRLGGGLAEQDADELWKTTAGLIKVLIDELPEDQCIEAIAVSSVGEAGVLLDSNGTPLYPIIAWFDRRAEKQALWWERSVGFNRIYELTGMLLDPLLSVNKILWIREMFPEIFKKAYKWLSIADYIEYKLCGKFSTDQSLASRTMVFNQSSRSWSQELLDVAGLRNDLFPEAFCSGKLVGFVKPDVYKETGLKSGIPVVLGGHDHLCGAYVARQGKDLPVDSTGTAEVLIFPSKSFLPTESANIGYLYCYADVMPDRYVYSARVGYAGALVEWLRREIFTKTTFQAESENSDQYRVLMDTIPKPLNFSGLICYPSFGRVISPNWNRDEILGGILGLTIDHNQGHILQAIIEATAFSLRSNIETLEKITGIPIDHLLVEGGATKNELWMQLKADITGCIMEASFVEESTVLGAALISGIGVGIYKDHLDAASKITVDTKIYRPEIKREEDYNRVYSEVYQKLPILIRSINRSLNGLF